MEYTAMVRTQISLTDDQHGWLKEQARSEDVSMSELVRRALELMRRHREDRKRAVLDSIGAFVADRDDVAANHDGYLAGTYAGEED
jgi:Arc/MetJ-type ribon-helix-helix transcriptional regulator